MSKIKRKRVEKKKDDLLDIDNELTNDELARLARFVAAP